MKFSLFSDFTKQSSLLTAAIALLLLAVEPGFTQTHVVNALPGAATTQLSMQLPKGTEIVARLPLNGQPIARLYTQWEYGRSYLYIEHSPQSLTTVDVTRKRKPRIVSHAPADITPVQYEELAEGGTIRVSPFWNVNPSFDTVGDRGIISTLKSGNPADAALLNAVGPEYSNLADRDHHLVYLASSSQLLIVQDKRFTAGDRTTD